MRGKVKGNGRKTPYTEIGIRRLKCSREGCANKATSQWQICADGRLYRPICSECDAEINRMVLAFMGDPDIETKMSRYKQGEGE